MSKPYNHYPSKMVQATFSKNPLGTPDRGAHPHTISLCLARFLYLLLTLLSLGIFCPGSVSAGGVADFGTVSKSKITLNPAGAAAIDRIFFDITAFQFEQSNTLSPLDKQARVYGSPGKMLFYTPYGTHEVESITYDKGDVTGGHVDVAYPTKHFTVGIGYDDRKEDYSEGRFFSSFMSASAFNTLDSDIQASYRRKTTSILLAIPMRGLSLGIRQNQREVSYETRNMKNTYIGNWSPPNYGTGIFDYSPNRKIAGTSSYQFNDYGVMLNLSAYQPKLDVGFLVRPSVNAIMEFDPDTIGTTGSSAITLEKMPFTEPGLNLTTVAVGMNSGRVMAQVILEAGDYTDAGNSFQAIMQPGTSKRNRAFDIDAFLLRLTFNPFFEVAYGVRNQEIAGSLTNITSQVIKFPIPMGDTLVLTIGSQTITVLDENDDRVTQGTSYSLSAEMKFGKPVTGPGRRVSSITGRGLPPKTKRLPYYMEY
jgi:hypothetical protein